MKSLWPNKIFEKIKTSSMIFVKLRKPYEKFKFELLVRENDEDILHYYPLEKT
jgi:hypothetical protein